MKAHISATGCTRLWQVPQQVCAFRILEGSLAAVVSLSCLHLHGLTEPWFGQISAAACGHLWRELLRVQAFVLASQLLGTFSAGFSFLRFVRDAN